MAPSGHQFVDLVHELEGGNPKGLRFILVSFPNSDCREGYLKLSHDIVYFELTSDTVLFHLRSGKVRSFPLRKK